MNSLILSSSAADQAAQQVYKVQDQLKGKSDAADLAASLLSAYRETLIMQQSAE